MQDEEELMNGSDTIMRILNDCVVNWVGWLYIGWRCKALVITTNRFPREAQSVDSLFTVKGAWSEFFKFLLLRSVVSKECFYRVQKRWPHKKKTNKQNKNKNKNKTKQNHPFFFLDFSVLDTLYRWSMIKNYPQPKLFGNGFIGARDMAAWIPNDPGQFTPISMGLIRYSCGHISGHHEPIHVKFGVWGFFIMSYWNIVMEMLKCKKENLMMSHFSTLCWS